MISIEFKTIGRPLVNAGLDFHTSASAAILAVLPNSDAQITTLEAGYVQIIFGDPANSRTLQPG